MARLSVGIMKEMDSLPFVAQADVVVGLSVGIMTVPQSLSYARIAGLPSEYGLYGAFAPVFANALWQLPPAGNSKLEPNRIGSGVVLHRPTCLAVDLCKAEACKS